MSEVSQAFEDLARITLAPYILLATQLIGKPRQAGSNMFRHQLETMAVLIDYKLIDPVLLKAACVHDLIEDGFPTVADDIRRVDEDGPAVLELVLEVSRRVNGSEREPKGEFLTRIMTQGSRQAQLLKLADRITNLVTLGYVHDRRFIRRTVQDTKQFILPYAEAIHPHMYTEINDLVGLRWSALQTRPLHRRLLAMVRKGL